MMYYFQSLPSCGRVTWCLCEWVRAAWTDPLEGLRPRTSPHCPRPAHRGDAWTTIRRLWTHAQVYRVDHAPAWIYNSTDVCHNDAAYKTIHTFRTEHFLRQSWNPFKILIADCPNQHQSSIWDWTGLQDHFRGVCWFSQVEHYFQQDFHRLQIMFKIMSTTENQAIERWLSCDDGWFKRS